MGQHCTYNNMLMLLNGGPKTYVSDDLYVAQDGPDFILFHNLSFNGGSVITAKRNGTVRFDVISTEDTPEVLAALNLCLSPDQQLTIDDEHRLKHPDGTYVTGRGHIIRERLY